MLLGHDGVCAVDDPRLVDTALLTTHVRNPVFDNILISPFMHANACYQKRPDLSVSPSPFKAFDKYALLVSEERFNDLPLAEVNGTPYQNKGRYFHLLRPLQ